MTFLICKPEDSLCFEELCHENSVSKVLSSIVSVVSKSLPKKPKDVITYLENIFSKILRSEIDCEKILENKHALAFLDINPQAPIHILIIPKNKYIDFYDFTQNGSAQEIKHFWELVNDVINKKNISDSGFRLITNSGKDGNQDVPHFHVHLLGGKNLGKMIN